MQEWGSGSKGKGKQPQRDKGQGTTRKRRGWGGALMQRARSAVGGRVIKMILKRVPIEWANVLEQPLRLVILDDKRAYYVNKKTDKPFLVRPGLPILMRIKAATELMG